jgi:hypothetical protein
MAKLSSPFETVDSESEQDLLEPKNLVRVF